MPHKPRGAILTIFALLFALLAITNFLKPLRLTPSDGFVLLRTRLTGAANAIVGPLFGIILLVPAYGIWAMRRFALPLAYIYTACVAANMILFSMKHRDTRPLPIVNVVAGIGVPLATAIVLHIRRADLT
ncbi:MAG: hypothetical protein ACREQH_14090 [Candidatus Binatus sp.]